MTRVSQIEPPKVVLQTPVVTATKNLLVATIRVGAGWYNTVVVDESASKRHTGLRLGGYVIDRSVKRAATPAGSVAQHREAVNAARTEEPMAVTA